MATLNFPTTDLVAGVTEYSANGTTYLWDGVKWVGRTAGGAAGTNSIQNAGYTVQVDGTGKLVLPAYLLPNTTGTPAQVLTWPASGSVLEWTNQTGGSSGPSLGNFTFADSTMHIPVLGGGSTSYLNAGGVGHRNSVQIRTEVNYVDTDINTSEIAIEAGNGGFSTQVTGHWTGGANGSGGPTLVYAGVENVSGANGPGFAGMVAIDPGVTSQYAVAVSEDGKIFLSVGEPVSTTEYTAALGVLTTDINGETGHANLNGILVNQSQTIINGKSLIAMSTDRGTVLFGNQPEVGVASHFHIMPADPSATDLFFGNDTNYVKLPRGTGNVVIGAEGPEWNFRSDGNLQLPVSSFGLSGAPAVGPTIHFPVIDSGTPVAGGSLGAVANGPNGSFVGMALTSNNYSWKFDTTGNLTLPTAGNINFANGINILSTVTGGGNGTANRVQFANAGSIYQAADNEPGRYNIVVDAEKDIIFNTNEGGQQFRFTSTGNLQLPRLSTISDQDLSVDLVIDRASDNPFWYNLFGDTGATVYANATINGSVVHDLGGNVYVLGSTVGNINNNLFLKYSATGQLLWRRTWTDHNGLPCGSYNASLRYIAANVALGTQDTILWAAQVPVVGISYVGTMDMDGNMVDQFGASRLPVRLDNFAVTDLEWQGNVSAININSGVLVVGQLRQPDSSLNYPVLAAIDLDTAGVYDDLTVVTVGAILTAGYLNGPPWVNQYKAMTLIPAMGPYPILLATVGSYYDGVFSHAMVTISGGGGPLTLGIGVSSHNEDNIMGEDICCDVNGNVYVIVNSMTSNHAVLIKANASSLQGSESIWQRVIGPPDSSSQNSFYATAVACDNSGHVYVLGEYYDNNINDTDVMLIKFDQYNSVVWSRRIGSPGEDGSFVFGAPGWESSSGIHVQDGLIVISFATKDRTPGLNDDGPSEHNTVTLQYPQDGSLLGTFGDFVISDFDPGHSTGSYSIDTLTTSNDASGVTTGFATLLATTAAVGTGWTNTQWDLENNREVFGLQTFKFNADGTFDTPEIKHQGEVKITANTVSGTNASTWTFQNNDGLLFPDGSVQYGAYVEQETALDGGSANTVYNIIPRPLTADGGGSSSRHGVTDPVYDGSSGENYVLDGGGA